MMYVYSGEGLRGAGWHSPPWNNRSLLIHEVRVRVSTSNCHTVLHVCTVVREDGKE